ncbi:MAG: type 1 glutamine amidotransferase, partial [Candidatus Zixiibacteriota bacterium]
MKPVAIIQNCEVESAGNIKEYFSTRSIRYTETLSYKNQKFPDLSKVGAIINLGCPLSVTQCKNHKFLSSLFEFTKEVINQDKPHLGVCFGGQMLALALGAKVSANRKKEIGTSPIRLTNSGKKDPLFKGFKPEFPVFQWHGDTFGIPPGAANLAESDDCINQAFRKGRLAGVQFHLEADDEQVPLWCDTYIEELAGEGKDKHEIIASYNT